MKLVKKLRIKVNKDCKDYLDFSSEKCRLIYNFALDEKIKEYKEKNINLSMYDLKKKLPELKKQFPDYQKVYNKCLSIMYFRLDKAFKNFFRRLKENSDKKGFPKFKNRKEFITQEYPAMYIKIINKNMFVLPTGKSFNNFIVRTYEDIPVKFSTLTITKEKENYFACFLIEIEEEKFKDNGEILAIDLGVKKLVTGLSSLNKFVEVDKFSHYTKHLDILRSKRDKCIKYSRRWKKWNKIFHRQISKYARRITDYLHKVSYWLTTKNSESTIVVGDLKVTEMKTNKSYFNRIIQNEWCVNKFVELLSYKCKLYGKKLVKINEKNTTKTCSNCGRLKEMKLSERTYKCACGFRFDRDRNSAINIMKKYCVANAIIFNNNIFKKLKNLSIDTFVYT